MPSEEVVASKKRGRPSYLPKEFDEKLRTFVIAQRRVGENINRQTVYGVLMGLIKSNLHLYKGYLEFTAIDGWLYFFFFFFFFLTHCLHKKKKFNLKTYNSTLLDIYGISVGEKLKNKL